MSTMCDIERSECTHSSYHRAVSVAEITVIVSIFESVPVS